MAVRLLYLTMSLSPEIAWIFTATADCVCCCISRDMELQLWKQKILHSNLHLNVMLYWYLIEHWWYFEIYITYKDVSFVHSSNTYHTKWQKCQNLTLTEYNKHSSLLQLHNNELHNNGFIYCILVILMPRCSEHFILQSAVSPMIKWGGQQDMHCTNTSALLS